MTCKYPVRCYDEYDMCREPSICNDLCREHLLAVIARYKIEADYHTGLANTAKAEHEKLLSGYLDILHGTG